MASWKRSIIVNFSGDDDNVENIENEVIEEIEITNNSVDQEETPDPEA